MAFLGGILTVDLSTGQSESTAYPQSEAERLLGGRGANARFLYDAVPVGTDPLGPANPLILSAGLLTGTAAPASSRLHIGALSPLTGLLGSSNVGAHFGAELRAAGWQVLIVRGMAERPVYLAIDGEGVRVHDAGELWGLDAWRTQSALAERSQNAGAKIMAIGPGGERLVRFACIMTERGHAAGRTGMGAVMGAKNLKAIVVRGGREEEAVPEAGRAAVHAYARAIRQAPRYPTYAKYSNGGFITWADELGILATRNYRQNRFEAAASIDGKRLIDYVTKPRGCHRCPVHCKAEVRIERGRFAGMQGERPDIEPIMALGARCGVADPEAVLHMYNLCGRLGIDAISAGAALAFATDLYEQGVITASDTDGLVLRWGDDRALAVLLERIANRQGFGDILAEGVARAARIIGRGAELVAYHSKGLELTGYDPRAAMGTALGYAVSNRGADFASVYPVPEYRWDAARAEAELGSARAVDRYTVEGKGLLVRRTIAVSAALDALGLCKVPALSVIGDFSLRAEAALASALTGWSVAAEDLLGIGERIVTLEKMFNLRHGAGPSDDALPAFFGHQGLPHDPARGQVVNLAPMLADYYTAMGWDAEGCPTPATLRRLGLEAMA